MSKAADKYPAWVSAMREENEDASPIEILKNIVARLLSTFTAPFRLAISKPARRIYLTSFFFFIASIILLTISSVAYSIFYYNYIPQISLEKVIHLQFGDDAYPYGLTSLSPPQVLTTNQEYDVFVTLKLPRTNTNLAAGNFMLDLQLLSSGTASSASSFSPTTQQFTTMLSLKDHTVISQSRRPTILPQPTHSLLSAFDTLVLRLPWSILTYPFQPARSHSILTLESDVLLTSMFESISFSRNGPLPDYARLEIQTMKHVQTPLQIYSATLHFYARFTGMKHLIYNYRILSFILFTTIFYITSISTMAVVWLLISLTFWMRDSHRDHDREKLSSSSSSGLSKLRINPLTNEGAPRPSPPPKPEPSTSDPSLPIPSISRIGTSGSTTAIEPGNNNSSRATIKHEEEEEQHQTGLDDKIDHWRHLNLATDDSPTSSATSDAERIKSDPDSSIGAAGGGASDGGGWGDSGLGTSIRTATGTGAESSSTGWERGRRAGRQGGDEGAEGDDNDDGVSGLLERRRRSRLFGDE